MGTMNQSAATGHALLLAADGQEDLAIAAAVGCARQRCARVRQRFLRGGLEGLREVPRTARSR